MKGGGEGVGVDVLKGYLVNPFFFKFQPVTLCLCMYFYCICCMRSLTTCSKEIYLKLQDNSTVTCKVPKSNCTAYERPIAIQGPKIYNSLLNVIEINCSIHVYAKQLKEYYSMNLDV